MFTVSSGRKSSSPQKKSYKQKQEEKLRHLALQRREIQHILTLDDPQEQADRFLRFLKRVSSYFFHFSLSSFSSS